MTKDEALKLALAFIGDVNRGEWAGSVWRRNETVTAINEALAQSEVFSKQNYLSGYCVGQSDLLAEQANQEPAAWMVYTQDGKSVYITDNPTDIESNQRALPLYVTPQRKEWVGLTKDDVTDWDLPEKPTVFEFAKFVEAKLKDKNHDTK